MHTYRGSLLFTSAASDLLLSGPPAHTVLQPALAPGVLVTLPYRALHVGELFTVTLSAVWLDTQTTVTGGYLDAWLVTYLLLLMLMLGLDMCLWPPNTPLNTPSTSSTQNVKLLSLMLVTATQPPPATQLLLADPSRLNPAAAVDEQQPSQPPPCPTPPRRLLPAAAI